MSNADLRVRRPDKHETLIQALKDDAGFPALRDVLVYSAVIGFEQGRRLPFDKSGEPIRYDILLGSPYAETIVNMLAATCHPDDAEILDDSRLGERIRIFEEFANGGLEFLQGQINTQYGSRDDLIRSLVTDALVDTEVPGPIGNMDLTAGL